VALRANEHGDSPFYHIFAPDVFCLPQAKVNIGSADGILPVVEG
jgi:hypothetical protein